MHAETSPRKSSKPRNCWNASKSSCHPGTRSFWSIGTGKRTKSPLPRALRAEQPKPTERVCAVHAKSHGRKSDMEASDIDRNKLVEEAVEHIAALHEDRSGAAHARFASWVRGSKWHVEAVLIATAQLRELARLDAMAAAVAVRERPANDDSVRAATSLRRVAIGVLGALAASVLVFVVVWYGYDHQTPTPGSINVKPFVTAGTF